MHSLPDRPVSGHKIRVWAITLSILALCAAGAVPLPGLDAQGAGTHSAEWIQSSSAEFAAGEWSGITIEDRAGGELTLAPGADSGIYTSPVGEAGFGFTAAAPFWRLAAPAGQPAEAQAPGIAVELRVRERGAWSPWFPADEPHWVALRGAFYPEMPVLSGGGEAFQYRVRIARAPDGSAPVLDAVGVVYIDTSDGPTTEEARAAAEGGEVGAQGVAKPAVISRAAWGANESWMTWPPEYRAVFKIIVHHTTNANDYAQSEAAGLVRGIYEYHARTLDWGDIGYNYLVDHYGNVYEGRAGGPGVVAAHAYSYNYGSMGVSVIGTHTADPIPAASRAALIDLAAWEADRAKIHPLLSSFFKDKVTPNLGGHRDYNTTTCPGDALYAELPALRAAVWERIQAQGALYEALWPGWTPPASPLHNNNTYPTTVQVRNNGWGTWTPPGGAEPVSLGYRWLEAGGAEAALPPGAVTTTPLSTDVSLGETHTFAVQLTTPVTPGTYTLEWDMARAGGTRFHTLNPDSLPLTRTIQTVPMFAVSGAIDDLYGAPLVGARVTASNGSSAVADAAGTYTLALPISGTHTLTACPPGAGSGCAPAVHGVASAGETISYSFALPPLGFHDGVTNGHLEAGLDGWLASGAAVTTTAHTGLGGAALRAEAPGSSAWISQAVTLPSGAAAAGVSLFYRVPSAPAGARLEVQVISGTETVSDTLPLTGEWAHGHRGLPAGWEGELTLICRITNGDGPAAAVVVVDEIALGHRTGMVYLPAVLRAHPGP